MKIKVSELEGAALDWAVGQALGWSPTDPSEYGLDGELVWITGDRVNPTVQGFHPSTDWSIGGPLMTRLEMLTRGHGIWYAIPICVEVIELSGKTPLIAAMRAIVASDLGDEVDIPDELLES